MSPAGKLANGHDAVSTVVGLAPWIPDQLDLEPLRGRRLVVVHGALDRPLPRVPGVSPAASRRGFDRAVAHGAVGTYTLIPGALHAIALSGPRGRPIALPRAGRCPIFCLRRLRRSTVSGLSI